MRVKSLPMLEYLKLRWYTQLTEQGLLEMLKISGNSLKTVIVHSSAIFTAVKDTLCIQYPSVNI